MTHFTFAITVSVIYVHFISQLYGQYTQIWYDDMEQNNGWSSSGSVFFGYSSSGCHNGLCTKTEADSGGDAFIYKSTNVVAYSSLQLQFDVSADELESGESCKIYYAYNSQSAKEVVRTIYAPDENRHFFNDETIDLPSASSASTVWIWFEADGGNSGSDRCYWDNVYLRGILTPQPTPNPTRRPTLNPTRRPTPNPTKRPTVNPTAKPTANPSSSPTKRPTPQPTDGPTKAPSPEPTDQPTTSPTKYPSLYPTKSPTQLPTLSPTDPPSPAPTDQPSRYPTNQPSVSPTDHPTKDPTPAPTDHPTVAPSPSPTDLPTPTGTLRCGDSVTDSYEGQPIQFIVNLPYSQVDLQFDGSQSTFNLAQIDAFVGDQTMYLGKDVNGIVSLANLPVGNYKFVMYGDAVVGEYTIEVRCSSKSPTPAPSTLPTPAPTTDPTQRPTAPPTVPPTERPTVSPTDTPIKAPTEAPSSTVVTVTTAYWVRIELCDDSTEADCDFSDDDITNRVAETLSDFVFTVSDIQTVDDTVIMEVSVTTERDQIMSNHDLKDEFEKELEPDYPDVNVRVSQDTDEVNVTATDTDYMALIMELRYILVVAVVLFAACCCFAFFYFFRQRQLQRDILQRQMMELNRRKGIAEMQTNTNANAGEGAETNEMEFMETNAVMPVSGPGMQPKAALRVNAGDSSQQVTMAPSSPVQMVQQQNQMMNNMNQMMMNMMMADANMNAAVNGSAPGAGEESETETESDLYNNDYREAHVSPGNDPDPVAKEEEEDEDYEYYYDEN